MIVSEPSLQLSSHNLKFSDNEPEPELSPLFFTVSMIPKSGIYFGKS